MKLGDSPHARTVILGLVVSAVVAVGISIGTGQDADARATSSTTAPSTTTSGSSTTTSGSTADSTQAVATTPTFDSDAVDEALDALGGNVSLAALNLDTGAGYSSDDDTYDTASIVKVDILAALLHLQDGELTATQKSLATAMIERSDNAAATALFEDVGGASGLEAVNEVFGLTDTTVGTGGLWGLTQTTAADQVKLLEVVFGEDSVLSEGSQQYMAGLMENVIDAQHFGVSAAADEPEDAALKVGYLQRSATGLWDVTSIGRVEIDGETWLVAVLSDANESFSSGQSLVEDAADLVRLGAGA